MKAVGIVKDENKVTAYVVGESEESPVELVSVDRFRDLVVNRQIEGFVEKKGVIRTHTGLVGNMTTKALTGASVDGIPAEQFMTEYSAVFKQEHINLIQRGFVAGSLLSISQHQQNRTKVTFVMLMILGDPNVLQMLSEHMRQHNIQGKLNIYGNCARIVVQLDAAYDLVKLSRMLINPNTAKKRGVNQLLEGGKLGKLMKSDDVGMDAVYSRMYSTLVAEERKRREKYESAYIISM